MKHLTFDITSDCNLRCKHCYNNKYFEHINTHVDYADVIKFIRESHNNGCESINFLGGEPLLRKDIINIIDFCSSINIKSTLTTNGILLNFNMYKKLINSGLDNIDISIDGLENNNDTIRVKGVYRKVLQNLSEITKNISDIRKLRISYTITRENIDDFKFLVDEMKLLGIHRFIVGTFLDVNQKFSETMNIDKDKFDILKK